MTSRVKFGITECDAVRWSSSSSIMCKTARGSMGAAARMQILGLPVYVTLASQIGSDSIACCGCVVMSLLSSRISITGSTLVHVMGTGIAG